MSYKGTIATGIVGGNAFPHSFALVCIKTWVRSRRCAGVTQIRTARQKSSCYSETGRSNV